MKNKTIKYSPFTFFLFHIWFNQHVFRTTTCVSSSGSQHELDGEKEGNLPIWACVL